MTKAKKGEGIKKQIVLVMALLLIVTATAYAYDAGDFQIWNANVEEFKVNNNSKIALEQEFRWADNASEFYYHHYDAGFFYDLKKYLNVGAGYRHIYELKQSKFKIENEPYICLGLIWDSKGFKFEDRSRMEYRHFSYQTDLWRYRNKFTVKAPWKFTKIEIQPYLSDEIFVGLNRNTQFNQNRFYSGFGMNLTKNVKAEAYYMIQSTKSSKIWKDVNVLGTKLKIAF